MKKAVLALTILLASAPALMAQLPYDETCRKATRAFDAGEWATASALYNFMIHERPADISAYAPAIVAVSAVMAPRIGMVSIGKLKFAATPLILVLATSKIPGTFNRRLSS